MGVWILFTIPQMSLAMLPPLLQTQHKPVSSHKLQILHDSQPPVPLLRRA